MAGIGVYIAGTATVAADGTTVTGQGTLWVGAISPGDKFGSHVGRAQRILSVNSNTSLTLAFPWKGPAQTAAPYEIEFTPYQPGYRKDLQDIITMYGDGEFPALSVGGDYRLAPIHVGDRNFNGSSDAMVLVSRNISSGAGSAHAFSDSSDISRPGNIGYNSYDCRVTFSGTANFDHYSAFQVLAKYESTGTMTDMNPFWGTFNALAGEVTRYRCFWVGNPYGPGVVRNAVGLYVDELTKGVDSNYAIFAAGNTVSRLGGGVGIGTNPEAAKGITVKGLTAAGRVAIKDLTDAVGNTGMAIESGANSSFLWQYNNVYLGFGTNNAERMRIAAGGDVSIAQRLTIANQPTAILPGPASAFSTAAAVIPFGTPAANIGGHWSASLNRFTCPVAGNYLVSYFTEVDRDGWATASLTQQIRRNGATQRGLFMTRGTGAANGRYIVQSLTAVLNCAANDYIDVYNVTGYVEAGIYSGLSITLLN